MFRYRIQLLLLLTIVFSYNETIDNNFSVLQDFCVCFFFFFYLNFDVYTFKSLCIFFKLLFSVICKSLMIFSLFIYFILKFFSFISSFCSVEKNTTLEFDSKENCKCLTCTAPKQH